MSGANQQSASSGALLPGASRSRWLLLFAFLLWSAAVGLAFRAQYLIAPLNHLALAAKVFAVAAALGLAATLLIDRYAPLAELATAAGELEPWQWTSLRRIGAIALFLAGIGGVLASVRAVETANYRNAFVYWASGLAVTAMAMEVGSRRTRRLQPRRAVDRRLEVLAVVALIAVALSLRLPHLEAIPPEVHGDEAACGLEGRSILHGEVPNLFSVGWYNIPYLSFAISAASMRVFGDDLWGFRMASVIQGTLSVVLLYVLGKRLFSARIGFIAAALLALSHWHIHFSRSGINYMQALFATLLVLAFVVRGIQERRAVDWLIAGYAVGLCVNVYYAARLAPALAALYLLHRIVFERGFLRAHWLGIGAMGLGALLFFAPMGVVFARAPKAFMSRTEGVFLLTDANLHHAYYTYQMDSIPAVLLEQVTRTVEAFNWRGETSLQHNHKGPLLDFFTASLFVVGVAAYSLRLRRSRFFLLGVWFWLALTLGSVLTVDALFSPRVIVILPTLMLFAALVADAGWRATSGLIGRWGTRLFAIPTAALLVLAARANYRDYFHTHIGRMQSAGINTTLARYVERINDRYQVWLLGPISLRYDTEHFLIPNVDGVEAGDIDPALPLDRIPAAKGVAFLVAYAEPDGKQRFERIQKAYPQGKASILKTPIDIPVFHLLLVENSDLAAVNPTAQREPRPIPALRLADFQRRPVPRPAQVAPSGAVPVSAPRPPQVAGGPWLPLPELAEPLDVAVGHAGEIYVADRVTRQVERFDAHGQLQATIKAAGDKSLEDPRSVAVGPTGDLYVLDSEPTRVHVFDAAGKFTRTIALPGGYFPSGINIDPAGAILVADTGQSRAVRLTPDGRVTVIGKSGNEKTVLDQPTDVAVAADGEIFVVDGARSRVVVFGPDFAFRREWEIPTLPVFPGQHLLIVGARVLVSQPDQGVVLAYDPQGKLEAEYGRDQFRQPVGMALAPDGQMLVTDVGARGLFRIALDQANAPGSAAAK